MSETTLFSRTGTALKLLAAACLVLAMALWPVPHEACAALKAKGAVQLQDTWNPHPDPDKDIVLPMPQGLSMVFRVVAVPASGYLWSMPVHLGVNDADDTRSYYDSTYTASISAPFGSEDIPASWKKSLPEDAEGNFFYYLMAKYEVSRLQWKAVMEDNLDISSLDARDAQPMTGISWYEAVTFTQRYTEWLLENHPDKLPAFHNDNRNTGFVRLPTEPEWEYAARGGQNDSTNYRQQDFFSMEENAKYSDYAVYRAEGTAHGAESLAGIGSRKPNPLGLYDTAGNAAEMTLDAFRFSVGGQLMGSAGGFIRKGGSYLSSEEEIKPGRREEIAPFLREGVLRARDLGFRPVISGINTPGGNRQSSLQAEYQNLSGHLPQPALVERQQKKSEKARPEAAATPLEELNRLIEATEDGKSRSNLLALRSLIEQGNILQAKERVSRVESNLQNCVMHLESIRNYEYRRQVFDKERRKVEKDIDKVTVPKDKKTIQAYLKKVKYGIKVTEEAIKKTLSSYRSDMTEISRLDDKDVQGAMQNLTARYRGTDAYNSRMNTNLKLVKQHYAELRKGIRPTNDAILTQLDDRNRQQ